MRTREPGAFTGPAFRELAAKARGSGTVSVIVTLDQPMDAEPDQRSPNFRKQQAELFAAQNQLVSRIHFGRKTLDDADRFETVPMLVMEVTEAELNRLMRDPRVVSLEFNRKIRLTPRLEEMRAMTNIEAIWPANRADKGDGATIAIIDDGVDSDLPSIKGRVIEEKCVSGGPTCFDPVAKTFSTRQASGHNAAWKCAIKPDKLHAKSQYCSSHGATVTSVAAAARVANKAYDGFGPKLNIIFIRIALDDSTLATYIKAFELAYTSSQFHLGKVITTSIGWVDKRSDAPCAGAVPSFDTIIKKIRASGLVVTNSSGNDESNTFIDFPACHPDVLAVGASTEVTDKIPKFSDLSYMVDFLAPGDSVITAPGGTAGSGTSYSTPATAATLALLKRAFPAKKMDDIVTGVRCGGSYLHRKGTVVSIPRIDAAAAFDVLSQPKPVQNFEFNAADALKDWTIGNGNWTIVNGEARYVPVKKFTTSAIYTDLCLDNFSAESSIKSISTVFEAYHPTLSSSLILNYVPRGDGTDGDLQAITGYKFTLQKTIGTTSSVASVSKLTDYILIPGQTPTSRQRVDFCTKTGVVFDHTVANLLRVVKTGRRLQFFVNGVLQCETQVGDDRFRSVGILATADIVNAGADPGRYTAVDYLRLTGK